MATQSREDLKSYFEDGDTPTEAQFEHLIDSMLNLADTGTQHVQGFISASGVNAGAYSLESLDFQTVTTDIQSLSLTSSNVFGSQSAGAPPFAPTLGVGESGVTSHSFFGPIYQSSSGAHSASYFLTPVGLGSTNNPIEGEGLYIESLKTIGHSTSSLTQASASSLLISRSTQGHLAFDANEIHQFGDHLHITAQGVSNNEGNIYFRTSVNPTQMPSASMTISYSKLNT